MGIFGWSYPPGCNGPPDYDWDEEQPRCSSCGAFIKATADKYVEERWIDSDCGPTKPRNPEQFHDVHQIEAPWGDEKWWCWSIEVIDKIPVTICRKCGAENRRF